MNAQNESRKLITITISIDGQPKGSRHQKAIDLEDGDAFVSVRQSTQGCLIPSAAHRCRRTFAVRGSTTFSAARRGGAGR